MKIKNKFSLVLSIIMIFSLTSCNFYNDVKQIADVKRISPEETKVHFSEYVANIEACIKENNIDDKYFDYTWFGDSGTIYFDCYENGSDISLTIYLYNDRSNPFGVEDYELGLEEYRITYQRMFSDEDDILNTDNSAFKIIPVVLSCITKDTVTEEEIKEHFLKYKDKINIKSDYITKDKCTLANFDCNFNNVESEYSLGYYKYRKENYAEGIVFGGFHNYSFTTLD